MTLTTDRSAFPPDTRFTGFARRLARLEDNARFGILTTDQHARRDGGSRQKVVRLLQACVEDKLLRRVDRGHELFLTSFFDARPRAFTITAKGLRVLAEAGITLNVSPKRSDVLLAHEIETAECMFSFAASVSAQSELWLVDQPELIAAMPPTTRDMHHPRRLKTDVHPSMFPSMRDVLSESISLAVECDRLFAIGQRSGHGWVGTVYGLELDRGSETLTAKRLQGKATWARKTLGYVAAWSQGLHLRQWGEMAKSFRILVVTSSLGRAQNIIELQQRAGAPPGLFLFSTAERLKAHGALGPAWVSAKVDGVSLIERT